MGTVIVVLLLLVNFRFELNNNEWDQSLWIGIVKERERQRTMWQGVPPREESFFGCVFLETGITGYPTNQGVENFEISVSLMEP